MGIVQGKRFGFNYEVFGATSSASTKNVDLVVNSSNSNLKGSKSIKVRLKGKKELLEMHWSGETAAWKLDSVQVLPGTDNANITGNWSKDDEFIIKKSIDLKLQTSYFTKTEIQSLKYFSFKSAFKFWFRSSFSIITVP